MEENGVYASDTIGIDYRLGPVEVFVFGILLATLYSLLIGYSYGTMNHVYIPMFYRHLDATYLINDFAVNASTQFDVRLYYLKIISPLAKIIPLPIVFLVLNWLVNFGVVLVTFFAAKDLFEGSHLVAMMACVLVMGTVGVTPGGSGSIASQSLVPSSLAKPLALFSLWTGIRGRAVTCALAASVASAMHPLIGLETGAIGLATAGLAVLLDPDMVRNSTGRAIAKKIAKVLIGACILGATAYILWISKYEKTLDTDQFMNIVAYFRHPHEYIPSTWPVFEWVKIICFLFAFGVSWNWWRNSLSRNKVIAYRSLIPVIIVLLLWCGGYVFVELFPSRLWTTAQTFRFSFILNWIGFIVIAGTIVRILWQQNGSPKASVWLILMGSGSTQPIFAFIGHFVEIIRRWAEKFLPKNTINLLLLFAFALAGLLIARYADVWHSFALLVFLSVVVWFIVLPARWLLSTIPLLVLCGFVLIVVVHRYYKISVLTHFLDKRSPIILVSDTIDAKDAVSLYARKTTPETAVFLTPPDFGRFRIVARRAIIVDFKMIPHQDWAIIKWKKRLTDCYREVEKTGIPAAEEMAENYKKISKERMVFLSREYGASYAILYKSTPSEFPTLYEDELYKLVRLDSERNIGFEKSYEHINHYTDI